MVELPSSDEGVVIESSGIRVTATSIEELEIDGTAIVTIAREEVTGLRIERGYVSERPILGVTVGLGLLAIGFALAAELLGSLFFREAYFGRRAGYLLTACATAIGIGSWLGIHAMRRGPFLAVNLRSDKRKLAFRADAPAEEIGRISRALQASPVWQTLLTDPPAVRS